MENLIFKSVFSGVSTNILNFLLNIYLAYFLHYFCLVYLLQSVYEMIILKSGILFFKHENGINLSLLTYHCIYILILLFCFIIYLTFPSFPSSYILLSLPSFSSWIVLLKISLQFFQLLYFFYRYLQFCLLIHLKIVIVIL